MAGRVWNKVTINVKAPEGEKSVVGSWSTSGRIITVKTPNGEKATQIGTSNPEVLAQMMLRELVREGKE